jgi:predicted nucleotide-binding protein
MMTEKNTKSEGSLSAKRYILNDEREKVGQAIEDRIIAARTILARYRSIISYSYPASEQVDNLAREYNGWNKYNVELLQLLFTDPEIVSEYIPRGFPSGFSSQYDRVRYIAKAFEDRVATLKSIIGRLPLYEKASQSIAREQKTKPLGKQVFIVHGHDEAVKLAVADTLKKLELDYIILHEQPDEGKTIIEKLEKYSGNSDIGYAVVLLTPDDVGKSKDDESEPKPRARQNVVFEMGYFISKLGRANVRALYSKGVELPTDYQGVLYTLLDDAGAWKYELADELEASGFNIDRNKLGRKPKQ